jgi:hypothetical protein
VHREAEASLGCSISRFILAFLSFTVLSTKPVFLILVISILITPSIAYAQMLSYVASTAAPEQLEECRTLEIDPEQYSEATILAKQRYTGPNCWVESLLPILDTVSLSLIIGSGIALIAGMFAVRKIKKVKKNSYS